MMFQYERSINNAKVISMLKDSRPRPIKLPQKEAPMGPALSIGGGSTSVRAISPCSSFRGMWVLSSMNDISNEPDAPRDDPWTARFM